MTALLYKDMCLLWRQMKLYIVLILLFACMAGKTLPGFAILYSAIMPVTMVALDERSKWDTLAAMMPYTDRDAVLSKYLFGLILMSVSGGISAASIAITGLASGTAMTAQWASFGLLCCSSVVILSVLLPAVIALGAEKGRFVMMAAIAAAVIAVMALGGDLATQLTAGGGRSLLIAAPIVALVLLAVSVPLSVRLYGIRRRG